jgi:hypothetical protein
MKEDEVHRACSTLGRAGKCVIKSSGRKPERKETIRIM